jgi:hypothetical protein
MTMRILFYGGCHGTVLRNLFRRFAYPPVPECRSALSYELVEQEPEFPYRLLDGIDAVVYSPILNKGRHNTVHLEEEAARRGVVALSYPWLEWHGYFPSARLGICPWAQDDWTYADILQKRNGFNKFDEFATWALEEYEGPEDLDGFVKWTTGLLYQYEQGDGIAVSDFIATNFRRERLFNTANHPGNALYIYVAKSIATRLHISLRPELDACTRPFMPEAFTPILPRVAARLGLEFAGAEQMHIDVFGPKLALSAREWLALYYYGGDRVVCCWPEYPATLVDADDQEIPIAHNEVVVGRKEGDRILVFPGQAVPPGLYQRKEPYWHERPVVDRTAAQ